MPEVERDSTSGRSVGRRWNAVLVVALVSGSALSGCGESPAKSSASHLERGRLLRISGDYEQASTELWSATRDAPDNIEARYLLGVTFLDLHQIEAAQDALYAVVQVKEDFLDARVRLADVMVQRDDRQNIEWGGQWAEKELAAKANGPNSAEAHIVLAIRDFRFSHDDTARDHLAQALKLEPTNVRAAAFLTLDQLVRGDRAGAQSTVLGMPPGAEVSEFQGEYYRLIGDATAASASFREARRLSSKRPEAAANLADSLLAVASTSPESESVLADLYRARDPRFQHFHALYLMRTGRSAQGIQELEEIFKRSSAAARSRLRYVGALIESGQQEKARQILDADLAQRPNARSYALRAVLRARSGQLIEAQADVMAGLTIDSNLPQLYYARALVQDLTGEPSRSQSDLNEALRVDPDFLPTRLDLIRQILAQRTATGATPEPSALSSALRLMAAVPASDARRPSVILLRGYLLLAAGQHDLAQRGFKDAGLQGPDAVQARAIVDKGDAGKSIAALRASGSPVLTPFSSVSLSSDLLEFPVGPIFSVFDLGILKYLNTSKSGNSLVF